MREELSFAYIYLAMSLWFDAQQLPGMTSWMKTQYQEETAHAVLFIDFIADRGGEVTLQGLPQPPASFDSPIAAFEAALAHEEYISGRIHTLYEMATTEGDHASLPFLQGFITEQIEEEKSVSDVIARLKMAGDDSAALLSVDQELGQRTE